MDVDGSGLVCLSATEGKAGIPNHLCIVLLRTCALQKPDRQPRSPERWKCIRSVFCSLQKILVCLMTFGGGSPMSSSLRLSADMIIAIKCRNLARKQQQLALVSKYLLSKN